MALTRGSARVRREQETYLKQQDFCRIAFGDPSMDVTRDRSFWSQSHATSCGKMKALQSLLRTWKEKGCKVLLFSYSTQMMDILGDFLSRQGYRCRARRGRRGRASRLGLQS